MNYIGRGPTLQFLERLTEIFQDLPVDDFELTFGIRDSDETRNAFNHQPKPVLARTNRLLGACPLRHVHYCPNKLAVAGCIV